MGRSKPAPDYQPQAKTAHINRVPSYEPPTYEHAVMEQDVIHNAFVYQPGWSGSWPANYVSEEQHHGEAFIGGNDDAMDVIYSVGHPGHVDVPMLTISDSPSVDLMDIDIPKEDLMDLDDPNRMDIEPTIVHAKLTPHPQSSFLQFSVFSTSSDLPRPVSMSEPQSEPQAPRPTAKLPKRPNALPPIQKDVSRSAFAPVAAMFLEADRISAAKAVEKPTLSGTQAGSSQPADLEQIIELLLKLDLSGTPPSPTVVSDTTSQVLPVDPVDPGETSVVDSVPSEPLVSLSAAAATAAGNSDSLVSATLTEIWNDLSGLEGAFMTPSPVDAPATIDLPPPASTWPSNNPSIYEFFELPDIQSETAFNVIPYDHPFSKVKRPSSRKIKNLSENRISRQKSQSIKSPVLGSVVDLSQDPRSKKLCAMGDLPKKGSHPHSSSGAAILRKLLARVRSENAKRAHRQTAKADALDLAIQEENPPLTCTDLSSQTPVQPSIDKVPERAAESPVSPLPKCSKCSDKIVPPQQTDTFIQVVLDTYVWVDSASEISKACPPEPPIAKANVPIVSATPVPGDFPLLVSESWHSLGTDFLSWLSFRLLGW